MIGGMADEPRPWNLPLLPNAWIQKLRFEIQSGYLLRACRFFGRAQALECATCGAYWDINPETGEFYHGPVASPCERCGNTLYMIRLPTP
jgi:hypothetical protein